MTWSALREAKNSSVYSLLTVDFQAPRRLCSVASVKTRQHVDKECLEPVGGGDGGRDGGRGGDAAQHSR